MIFDLIIIIVNLEYNKLIIYFDSCNNKFRE